MGPSGSSLALHLAGQPFSGEECLKENTNMGDYCVKCGINKLYMTTDLAWNYYFLGEILCIVSYKGKVQR